MKPEEALENLKVAVKAYHESGDSWNESDDEMDEALKIAIQALEKQIPKAYDIRCNADGVCYDCPDCGIKINRYTNYCYYCGQEIDWGNEE